MLGQVLGQGGSPAWRRPLCPGSCLSDGGAGLWGRPSDACPPVQEPRGAPASAACLRVDADVGGLAEAGLELGPPEVWPGGSFWPPSPLFLTSSFQEQRTVLRTWRQVWMQSQPEPRLGGPACRHRSSVGAPCPRGETGRLRMPAGEAFPSSPSSPWPARGMVTNTDRGWDLSVRAGGVSCTDRPTAVERGLDLATALPSKDRRGAGRSTHTQRQCLPVTLSWLHKYFINGRKENVPESQSQHVSSGHP